ncbi:hypothetical protein L7F22_024949 [Adiantum nelumboides]|nr:hypothetical protein [Adiantum nelumboides]
MMPSEEGGGTSLPAEVKSEPVDGPLEQAPDAPPENPSLAGLSVKVFDSLKPREAFNREMYRIPSYAGIHLSILYQQWCGKMPASEGLLPFGTKRHLLMTRYPAGWFSWGKIHTIERRALPEFFDGFSLSKTPKVYKEYREFIINKYRENPRRVLTFTEMRKMLVGDVNLMRKVYNFLVYWGLINYHATSDMKQQQAINSGEKSPSNHSGSDNKPKEVLAEGIDMARPESNAAVLSEATTQGVPGSALSASQAGEPALRSVDQPVSMLQATKVDSHKNAFLSSVTSSTEGIGDSQNMIKDNDWLGNWTTEEVLRLLEAIGKFGEDWIRVAAHVGTKSRLDCISRFIKLPFGDQFTSNIGVFPCPTSSGGGIQNGSHAGGDERKELNFGTSSLEGNGVNENFGSDEVIDEPPFKKNRLSPFADASNPILAQVAFLSAMVGPRVAAAAAQAAVAALAEEDPLIYQALNTGVTQVGCKDTGALSVSQAMSVKAEDADGVTVPSEKGCKKDAHALTWKCLFLNFAPTLWLKD